MSSFFEHVGPRKRVQAVLNVLVEAPFFYPSDDPELFAFLRRHRAEFSRFYEEMYEWQLVVDVHSARVYKTRWHNRALKPSQHDVFDLTRRDECIAFLIVLEFYERLLDERNADVDDPEPMRFEFGELFAFARARLTEELGDGAYDDEGVRRLLRALMPTLLRYRFLCEVRPSREEREGLESDRILYDCLPALHQYDVRVLGRSALRHAVQASDTTEDASTGRTDDASDDPDAAGAP